MSYYIFCEGRRVGAHDLSPADRELVRALQYELDFWERRMLNSHAKEWCGRRGIVFGEASTEALRPWLADGELCVSADGERGEIRVSRFAPVLCSRTVKLARESGQGEEVLALQAVASVPATDDGSAERPWSIRLEGYAHLLGTQGEPLGGHAVDLGDALWRKRAPSEQELERLVAAAAEDACREEGYRLLE